MDTLGPLVKLRPATSTHVPMEPNVTHLLHPQDILAHVQLDFQDQLVVLQHVMPTHVKTEQHVPQMAPPLVILAHA